MHLAGTYSELAATERDIHAGRMPERPFVLVGQQYLADPQRSVGNTHPVWSYAHVPNGYAGDATEAIIAQIERFAPGFRDRIIGQVVRTKNKTKHVYVSPGHLIDQKSATRWTLASCRGYRIPEPTRQAHLHVNHMRLRDAE